MNAITAGEDDRDPRRLAAALRLVLRRYAVHVRRQPFVALHRLSTVRRMDELVVLDDGRIAERGTHETLLAGGGIYAALWARQSGGFLATTDIEHVPALTSALDHDRV